MKQLVCLVILVALCGVTPQDAPEDVWTTTLFETLGRNVDLVTKEFAKVAPQHELELTNMVQKITKADNSTLPDESAGCVGCQAIITLLTYLVKMGFTMDDFRPVAMRICELLFIALNPLRPMPGQKVCPGVIDNFGHHVERVMRLNRLLPEESCYFLKSCSNDLPTFELPPLSGIISGSSRQQVNKKKQLKLPATKMSNNYRTKRRAKVQRDWHADDDIYRVAQFTDIHVDEHYKEGTFTECGMPLCCRELPEGWQPGQGAAGPYGEYDCNVPPSTTRLFLEKAKELNPDIVLYSGDSPPHHLWEEDLESQMNVTTWVAESLNEYFPDVTGIYSTLGNHECFPSNMYYPDHEDTQVLHETFIAAYEELSNFGEEQRATINKAGYFTTLIMEGLRLVSFNSNFGYTGNWYNLIHFHGNLYSDMMTWLDETLAKAKDDGEKVIMLLHHPVHGNVRGYADHLSARMVEYGDIIILNVVGHNHIDEFRVFRDESGAGKGVQFLSQSANTYSRSNPGVRMYYFDRDSYDLLGYEQYYLNITQREGEPEIKLLYRTDDDYELDDLSPESMLDFTSRMSSDRTLFNQFNKNRVSGADTLGECDDACWTDLLCLISTSTDEDREQCSEGITETSPAPTSTTTTPSTTTDGASGLHAFTSALLLPFFLFLILN